MSQCGLNLCLHTLLIAQLSPNALRFAIEMQALDKGSFPAARGYGWRTDATDSWVKTQGHHHEARKQQRKDRSAHEDNLDAQNDVFAP